MWHDGDNCGATFLAYDDSGIVRAFLDTYFMSDTVITSKTRKT
jgi:hypothetical protein